MVTGTMVVSGLAVGMAFGYALQRGRFCLNTGFRDVLLTRDATVLRAYVLAVLIQMVGVHLLAELGVITLRMAPFFWLAAIAGGFVFGVGMVLAGGCATGTWYRIGEGMVGSWLAAVGFAIAGVATRSGLLKPLQDTLRAPLVSFDGLPALPTLLAVNRWLVIGLLVVAGLIWLARSPRTAYQHGWTWPRTGITLGLIGTAAWAAAFPAGWEYGLSATQPTNSLLEVMVLGDLEAVTWGTFMILGLPVGSALAATQHGEFAWRAPKPQRLLQSMGGGALMGFGATLSGGCTVGHALTGVGVLGLTSLVATGTIVLGAWATVYLLFMRG
ncbi:MAG: YeeE/YedE family protein [Deltaproteobacteria bacterium]|nr:YeeE/YedE family protein [Deltaproteobacteria bacterium]